MSNTCEDKLGDYAEAVSWQSDYIEHLEIRNVALLKERDHVSERRNELVEKYEDLRAKCQSEGNFVSPYAGIQEMKTKAEEEKRDACKGMIYALGVAVMAVVALVVILAMTSCTESDVPEVVDQFNQEIEQGGN